MRLKILFRGSYIQQAFDTKTNLLINNYAEKLAESIVKQNHKLLFSGTRALDMFIANRIFAFLNHDEDEIRDNVEFVLPENHTDAPEFGVIQRYEVPEYWSTARTFQVSLCDSIISIGGEKGTADCIEKAILCKKPVFPVCNINGYPKEVWERSYYKDDYHFITPKDAEFILDENLPPEKFFQNVFNILDSYDKGESDIFFDRNRQRKVIEKWRNLVKEGKLEEGMNNTLKIADRIDGGLENQLIILIGQCNTIKKEKSLGLPEKTEELNRITLSYLEIIDELEATI